MSLSATAPSPPVPPSFLRSPGLWLFLLTFTLRLVVLTRFSASLEFLPEGDDMKFYADWALRIAHGQWTTHQAFYGLPGYAYCLALIFGLVRGFDPFLVGILQALLDSGVSVLLWKIALQCFAPTSKGSNGPLSPQAPSIIGIAAGVGWAVFTPAQAFSVILMPTVWLVFAYYVCLWFAVKTQSSSLWWPWLGLGIFVGVIAMLVATILFAIPLLVAAIILSINGGRPGTARLAKIVGAVVVLVAAIYLGAAPAWIHNYFIAHEPVMLSAHSGINFWIGNNPTATGYPKMPPGIRASQEGLLQDSITLAEKDSGRKLTRSEVSKYWSAKANAFIGGHFSAWMRLLGVKFGNFWNAYQYDDLSIIKLLRDEGVLPAGLKFGFIAALGLAGMVPAIQRFHKAGWIAAAVLLHMCALMPVFVTERYRLAAIPGLLLLAAAGLWIFWENLISSRWRRAGIYILLCGGAAWFTSIPRTDIGLWSLDHYKAGIRATSAGELELAHHNTLGAERAFRRAQGNLETAYAYVPNNPDIDFAIGNLWLACSNEPATGSNVQVAERTRAKFFYRRALELDGHHVGALNNLGVLAMEEKYWNVARKLFLAALTETPDDPKTLYLLAKVDFESGQTDAARAELEKALALRPHQKEFLELRDQIDHSKNPPAN